MARIKIWILKTATRSTRRKKKAAKKNSRLPSQKILEKENRTRSLILKLLTIMQICRSSSLSLNKIMVARN